MNTPLVSVILPCYNADQYLEEALNSIINQTYTNLEILLIDDGSTDQSASIYRRIEKQETRLKILVNTENIGLIRTLNFAINAAKGEFIARMDADDISNLSRIEKQVHFLTTHPEIDILGTNAIPIDEYGIKLAKESEIYLEPNTLKISSLFTQPLFHGSILAKNEVLSKYSYSTDYKHSEDFELWLRILSNGYTIANLPETLYYYRNNPNGVSNNNADLQSKNHNKASKLYIEKLMKKSFGSLEISILNNRPESEVKINDFKKSIQLLIGILQQIKVSNSKELTTYLIRQKLNIAIQALKESKNLSTAYLLIFLLRMSFNREGFAYFIKKLSR